MTVKTKRPAAYTLDFTTALPVDQCRQRLERAGTTLKTVRSWLVPISQRIVVQNNGQFTVERVFPGALYPVRLMGYLDPRTEDVGTWVHGAITHDAENQVLLEGLAVFVLFFVLSVFLFLRLKLRGFVITVPLVIVVLVILSLRWRALRFATTDMISWLRRKLYVTPAQVRHTKN